MNQSKNTELFKTPSKRIFYYDVLRALAIIGIVFCHVSVSYVSRDINSPNLYISVFFDCFRDFSIPIFVMLSGALLLGKKDTLIKFFIKTVHTFPVLGIGLYNIYKPNEPWIQSGQCN